MTGERPTGDAAVVPGIPVGSSLACVRSLARRGIHTIAATDGSSAPVLRSRYCRERARLPSPSADFEGYRDGLLRLADRSDVRTIVPLREADVYVLAKYADEFAARLDLACPSFETVRDVQDRLRLYEIARRVDVPVPDTELLTEWDPRDEVTVVKSRYSILVDGNRARYPGVSFVPAGDRPDVESRVAEMGHVPLAQRHVPDGGEYGFFALFDSGEPVATFQHRRVRSLQYVGGASAYRKSVRIPELETAGLRLLETLEWHGPAMVEFKRDERDGTFYLMEINPRFWGSLRLPVVAGVDFPSLYYQLATTGVDETVTEYDVDVGCHLLSGEANYLYSILEDGYEHAEPPSLLPEVYAVVRSVLTDPHFDYLHFDDPSPFVRDVSNALPIPSLR